jgi:hypothetical protein
VTFYGSLQTQRGVRAGTAAGLIRACKEMTLNDDGVLSEVLVLPAKDYKNSSVVQCGESLGPRTRTLEQLRPGMTNDKFDAGDTGYDTRGTYGTVDDDAADHINDHIPFGHEILRVLGATHEEPTIEWLGAAERRRVVYKEPTADLLFLPVGDNGLPYETGNLADWTRLAKQAVSAKQPHGQHLTRALDRFCRVAGIPCMHDRLFRAGYGVKRCVIYMLANGGANDLAMLQDVASDMMHLHIVTTKSYTKMVKQLCYSHETKRVNWKRLESFLAYRIDIEGKGIVDWLDVPHSKMHDRFYEATAIYCPTADVNADRDLATGELRATPHTTAAIDRAQGGMWSPDVIKSEAAQEAEFVRVYTKYTADVRVELMAAGVPEEHALELAAGKRTRPISRAALRTTSINVGGIVKKVDVDALFDKVRVCKEMLSERIAKRVLCFERGWLEKVVNRMQDRVRPGKENGDYAGRGETMG